MQKKVLAYLRCILKFCVQSIMLLEILILTPSCVSEDSFSQLPDKTFYCGFYTYQLDEKTAKEMSEAGFNAAYVRGGLRQERKAAWQDTEEDFIRALEAAKKHNMKLVVQAQGDRAYLNPNWTKEYIKDKALPKAVAFLKKYAARPEFLAYCVKEEPKPDLLEKLSFYYEEIKAEVPSAKLYMLHNRIRSALLQLKRHAAIVQFKICRPIRCHLFFFRYQFHKEIFQIFRSAVFFFFFGRDHLFVSLGLSALTLEPIQIKSFFSAISFLRPAFFQKILVHILPVHITFRVQFQPPAFCSRRHYSAKYAHCKRGLAGVIQTFFIALSIGSPTLKKEAARKNTFSILEGKGRTALWIDFLKKSKRPRSCRRLHWAKL